MHHLPGRIAAVMVGTILVLLLTVIASVLWLTRALDEQALGTSRRLAGAAVAHTLDQLSMLDVDYAKWDEAVVAVESGDEAWLYANMGTSATNAVATNLVVLWGGPLTRDLGWTDDGLAEGRSGLLGDDIPALAEAGLAAVPLAKPPPFPSLPGWTAISSPSPPRASRASWGTGMS